MHAVLARFRSRAIDRKTVALGLAIIGLNLVDAFSTLRHLDHGAEELNPLMQLALARGPMSFFGLKQLLASVGVIGIVAHPEVHAARVALLILIPIYALLALYQLVLFWVIP